MCAQLEAYNYHLPHLPFIHTYTQKDPPVSEENPPQTLKRTRDVSTLTTVVVWMNQVQVHFKPISLDREYLFLLLDAMEDYLFGMVQHDLFWGGGE